MMPFTLGIIVGLAIAPFLWVACKYIAQRWGDRINQHIQRSRGRTVDEITWVDRTLIALFCGAAVIGLVGAIGNLIAGNPR